MFLSSSLLALLLTSFSDAHPTHTTSIDQPTSMFQISNNTLSAPALSPQSLNATRISLQSTTNIRCFKDHFSALTPVDLQACSRELRFLQRLSNRDRKDLIQGKACPLHFRYLHDECEIMLGNVNAEAQGRFAAMDIVHNAIRILSYCSSIGANFGGQTGMDEDGFWWQVKGVPADPLDGSMTGGLAETA